MARAVTDPDDQIDARAVAAASTKPPADDTTDEITQLRNEIALRRQRLDTALHQLEHRVSEDLDWRRRIAEHPWLMIGAAALAGFAIGRFTGRSRSSENRFLELPSS